MVTETALSVKALEGLAYFKKFKKNKVWAISTSNKVPIQPNGTPAKSNDPNTWSPLKPVRDKCKPSNDYYPAIALTEETGLIFIDLDNVRNPDIGDISHLWAADLVRELNTYTEISRSGTGLHLFLLGKKPSLHNEDARCKASNVEGTNAELEMYDCGRLATVTGHMFIAKPIRTISQVESLRIYRQFFPHKAVSRLAPGEKSPQMKDEKILELLRKSKIAEEFDRLYAGDHSSFPSRSEADMRLSGMLSFYTQNEQQLQRILSDSGLQREKWNEHRSYLSDTIQKAISGLNKVYNYRNSTTAAHKPEDLRQLATELIEKKNACEGFDISRLPDPIKEHVENAMRVTDANPLMLTVAVVASVSAYCRDVYIEHFGKLYPNLYQLVLSRSGSFKTTAIKLGCYHITETEKLVCDVFQKELTSAQGFEKKNEKDSATENALKKRAKLSRMLSSRVTPEQLFVDLARGHGGLITHSEFSSWIASLEKNYSTSMKEIITDFYDTPDLYEVKARTYETKPIIIQKPYISIFGVSAPSWLENQVTTKDVTTGFFARFLVFYLNDNFTVPKPFPGDKFIPSAKLQKALERIGTTSGELTLHEDAKSTYEELYYDLYKQFQGSDSFDIYEAFIKRWCPTILKIAMQFHLLEEPHSKTIMPKSIVQAAYYVQFAIKSTIALVGSGLLESDFERGCGRILEIIAHKKGSCVRRYLQQQRNIPKGKDFQLTLNWLEESGQIHIQKPSSEMSNWIYSLCKNTQG